MITDSCSSITTKKQCRCPIALMYYAFYAQANHFKLLLPQGSCCSAPPRENTASSVSIDLSNTGKSYASAVKQTSQPSPSVKLPSTSTKATGSKQLFQASTSYNTTASSSNTKTRVKKPSMSPKAYAPKKSSIKQPTPVCKRTTSKGPPSCKQQTPVTKPGTAKHPSSVKQQNLQLARNHLQNKPLLLRVTITIIIITWTWKKLEDLMLGVSKSLITAS